MSSRLDSYKNLCLIEAQKSPLHYRHGCIIVRGGKVIGKGHNHYRPGFNGGALSTGKSFCASASSVDIILNLKKNKQKDKSKQKNLEQYYSGGNPTNTPLSIHSEMSAIRAALSLSAHDSGTSARGVAWSVKPCVKPSKSPKFKARLRAYVEAVCVEAERAGGRIDRETSSQGDKWRFEGASSRFESIVQQGPQFLQGVSQKRGEQSGGEQGESSS